MDDGCDILCPTCCQSLWIPVDRSGGAQQRFVTDCEVCCRPIHCEASVDPDTGGIHVDAHGE